MCVVVKIATLVAFKQIFADLFIVSWIKKDLQIPTHWWLNN